MRWLVLILVVAASLGSATPLLSPLEQPVVLLPAREWGVKLASPDLSCRVRDGKGVLIRSESRKRMFIRGLGLKKQPTGWYIDHIVPLACGGCDVPSNMSLLNETEWKAKMLYERRICGQQQQAPKV